MLSQLPRDSEAIGLVQKSWGQAGNVGGQVLVAFGPKVAPGALDQAVLDPVTHRSASLHAREIPRVAEGWG